MAKLSLEEIERLKLAGAAKRAERLEKKRSLEPKKAQRLDKSCEENNGFYRELSIRVKAAEKYLSDVIVEKQKLDPGKMSEILTLLRFSDTINVAKTYNKCHDEYCQLVYRCLYLQEGKAEILRQTAFQAWNKILFYPEVTATGWVIFSILHAGLVCDEVYQVLKVHRKKYVESKIGCVIARICMQMLKNGGSLNERTHAIQPWKQEQVATLRKIIDLFGKEEKLS